MADWSDFDEIRAEVCAIEPAARLVPRRALGRAIRFSQNRGEFSDAAVHDRAWWVDRDRLFAVADTRGTWPFRE